MAARKSLDFNQIAARVVAQATGQRPKISPRQARLEAAKAGRARAKASVIKRGKVS
jgi:hypothetical protein